MLDGALLFTRFAYPPNELGYCGPDATAELLERADAGGSGLGLRALAVAFTGAWPYLELIAAANRLPDPLDPRVVEAYWIGNRLLERVRPAIFAGSLTDRFPHVSSRERLLAPLATAARPHHAFHVFGVYPWTGLLRGGLVDQPLHVLDRCRIRWGRVQSVDGDDATVAVRHLSWDGRALRLDPPRPETARLRRDGRGLTPHVRTGEWCALHWNWVCTPLTGRQLAALRNDTSAQLGAVNISAYPAPAAVLA